MPDWQRNFNRKLWQRPPPVFPNGEPTPRDRRLALRMWRALDLQSQRWYVRPGVTEFCGLELSRTDLAKLGREWLKRE